MAIIAFVPSDGLNPGATLDVTAGAILLEQAKNTPFNTRSGGDRFPNGFLALGNNAAGNGPLTIWQWNGGVSFTKIATVGSPAGTTSTWPGIMANGNFVWGIDNSGGLNTPTFRKIDITGRVVKSSGPTTNNGALSGPMTPSLDETIMYYTGASATTIRRWDLVNNVALTTFVTTTDPVVGMWAIPNSTDIAVITQTAFSGVSPVNDTIIRYTAAAATVYSTIFFTEPATATDTTIEIGRDMSLTSVWVRTPSAPAYAQGTSSIYLNVDLLLGGTNSSVTIAVNADGAPTGTCPFLILGATLSPCSSIT